MKTGPQTARFAVATSDDPRTAVAIDDVVSRVTAEFGGEAPDLAFLFASPHHVGGLDASLDRIAELRARCLAGCGAEAVVGGGAEFEGVPAVALWAAALPGVEVRSARLELSQSDEGHFFSGIPDVPAGPSTLILLADPFSFPVDLFLRRCEEEHPGLQLLGGVASAARAPGDNRLLLDGEVHRDGAVGVIVDGTAVRPLVSQGCRPFGRHLVITKADRNAILGLRGRPAIEALQEQLGRLGSEERELLAHGLHLGIAIDARKERHERGDFLVRNVIGFDRESGAILVTDLVRAGQTVQFHLRDAGTASEDLHVLLRGARDAGPAPAGALLFTCNGRGRRLFQAASHDAGAVSKELGGIPLAGFFAAGEIGPVGGRNFLHGFTASLALFGDAGSQS